MTDNRIIDAHEVAELLRCDYPHALLLFRSGKIQAKKIGNHWLTTESAVYAYVMTPEPKIEHEIKREIPVEGVIFARTKTGAIDLRKLRKKESV